MELTQQLAVYVQSALAELGLPAIAPHLERPAETSHGDYATNVALVLFGRLDEEQREQFASPRQLADKIAATITEAIKSPAALIATVSVAGPGFINFQLAEHFLLGELRRILTNSTQLLPQSYQGKKVIVEYSSPNIAKPFAIGHLRSTIIGDAIANLLEKTGAQVMRDNHVGDWGTQFGKQIYAIKTWGEEAEIEQSPRPVKELVALYVKFHQAAADDPTLEEKGRAWFQKLEAGDQEARRLWRKCIAWSWKEFGAIYERLGVSFSQEFNYGRGLGESFFEDKMPEVLEILREKKLLQPGREGAQLFFFPDDKYPPAMILKKDGATLYHTRDLATDKYRLDHYQPDLIINEVGAEQELYFQQLFEMERILGWYQPGQRLHVKHGLYRFQEGKMSTRKGNVIWLEDVLQEAYERVAAIAGDRLDKASLWQVAIGALKWNDLKRRAELNVVFDWDEILKVEGNSGPYLQYTYTRAQSVLDKAPAGLETKITEVDLQPLERQLLSKLTKLDEVVAQAALELAPHQMCNYLFDLAQLYNSFYNQCPILRAENEIQQQLRLQLTQATATVLKTGLEILGIKTLKKM